MTDRSPKAGHAGERLQSFLWDTTQQGHIYASGEESPQSRAERVKRTIQGVEAQFLDSSSAKSQAHGGQSGTPSKVTTNTVGHEYNHHNSTTADLNGVGQQFQGYDRQ